MSAALFMHGANSTGFCTLLSTVMLSTAVLSIVSLQRVSNLHATHRMAGCSSPLHQPCIGCWNVHGKAQTFMVLFTLLLLLTVCHMWSCH